MLGVAVLPWSCPERNLEVQEMTLKVQMELQEELSRQLQARSSRGPICGSRCAFRVS